MDLAAGGRAANRPRERDSNPHAPLLLRRQQPSCVSVHACRRISRKLENRSGRPSVLQALPPTVFEVILVDGQSSDGTIDVARAIRPDVRVVRQSRQGKGNALISGFEASRGEIIVALDADGSSDAAEISRFVEALKHGADFAKGSRFIEGGGSADITPLRRSGNRILRFIANVLHGTRYTDLCYGYNAFWRGCLPQLHLDCDGFEVETVMNIRAARAKLRVIEVPSYERKRLHGESNLHVVRDGWRILLTIVRERLRTQNGQAPTV
jgi:glycosyltransferase involved in cell wall biosynthesis